MIKKILYIFIPVLAVLFMSHNASAFSLNENVNIIDIKNSPYVSYYNGSSWSNFASGSVRFSSDSGSFTSMRIYRDTFSNIDSFETGDYIVFTGFFSSNQIMYDSMGRSYTVGGFIGTSNENNSCLIIDLKFDAVQEYHQNNGAWYRADFQISCRVRSPSTSTMSMNLRVRPDLISVSGTQLNINFTSAILAQSSSDSQKEEEATQDAADNSATSGSNSSSNSQTATSSLLSVITSGIGAITSASPTNCKINGNMGNLNVGNIDLCSNPVPTFMALIGSIIAVLVVLPLVILLFNRFISIIRSFQR